MVEVYITYYYYFNRSGCFKPNGHNVRALKSQGTSKINSYCTAAIVLTKSDVSTQLQAKICSTHHGHSISLGYLRLQRNDRFHIASKLSQGVTFERILDDIRESIGDNVKRIHLTTRKDIQNIERSFGLREAKKHQDDATSVSLWVQEMSKSKVNPVLLYKTQGQNEFSECPSLKRDDFMLVIQAPNQKQLLQKFGSNIVCMDDTHGTNRYHFYLITVLVVDEFGEGCPVAWCLCNRTDLYILIDFLMAVKENVGTIKPQWVMTDDAEQYYKAWVAVFGLGPHKLLCTWHVDRAWRNAIKGIKDKEIAALVYHNIRVLLEESNPETFKTMLVKTLVQLNECPETEEFCKYFTIHYSKRAEEWAVCYRKAANINTNMYIESFHRTLKYIYFKGRVNKRIDNLIHILMKVSRDKAFERLCKLEKGEISARLVTIRKRHLASTKLPLSLVTKQSQREWSVQSADQQREYSVVLEVEKCPTNCHLLCDKCKTCIHNYSCTCMDYVINHTICKHIHLTATSAAESLQDDAFNTPITVERLILTNNSSVIQDDNKLISTKSSIHQMLSRIHVLTEKSSSLHELKLVAKYLTSAENIFEIAKPLVHSNSVIPSNMLIKPQRFQSTRKRKKNATLRLAKPTCEEKQVVMRCLEQNRLLYQCRKKTYIPGTFCSCVCCPLFTNSPQMN